MELDADACSLHQYLRLTVSPHTLGSRHRTYDPVNRFREHWVMLYKIFESALMCNQFSRHLILLGLLTGWMMLGCGGTSATAVTGSTQADAGSRKVQFNSRLQPRWKPKRFVRAYARCDLSIVQHRHSSKLFQPGVRRYRPAKIGCSN